MVNISDVVTVGFRHIPPLLAGLLALTSVQAIEMEQPDLHDHLMVYYDFEQTGVDGLANKAPGATGLNASRYGGGSFDSSANPSGPGFAGKADFNPGNGVSDRSALVAGNALNLVDTRDDAIVVPVGTDQLGGNFTISVWHALTPSGGTDQRPFVFEPNVNYDVSWGINPSGEYSAWLASQNALPGVSLTQNEWHHVAHVVSSDGTYSTLTLYVDGQMRGRLTELTSLMDIASLHFGRHREGTGDRRWDGMLDELAIWGRALSAAEIARLYRLGSGGDELSSLTAPAQAVRMLSVDPYADVDWDNIGQRKGNVHTHTTQSDGSYPVADVIDMYKGSGHEVLAITDHDRATWPWTNYGRDPETLGMLAIAGNELSRHHHAGSLFSTYTSSTTDFEDSIAGAAAEPHRGLVILNHPAMHWPSSFPRTTANVNTPLGSGLEEVTQGDFTIESWFRTTDANRHVLAGNYSTAYQGALNLELHTENRVRVYLQPRSGSTADLNVSAGDFGIDTRDGEWHHLAAVRTQGVLRLYLDGILVGQMFDVTASHSRTRVGPVISDRTMALRPETIALAATVTAPEGQPEPGTSVSFGVISDLHYGYASQALAFLEQFVDDMQADTPDFAIQLGDFCTPASGQPALDEWNTIPTPRYHVIGNHDTDGGFSADQVAAFWGMPGRYYSFDAGRIRGIVLDGNEAGGSLSGYKRYIGATQRDWLAQQLADADRPVIIFVHQPLDVPGSMNGLENGAEIMAIIDQAEQNRPGTVIAVMCGHLHSDYALNYNGIPYIMINSASYLWYDPVGKIEYTLPLWARVNVDFASGTLQIDGRDSDWAGTDPWTAGASDGAFDLGGAVYYLGRDSRTGVTQLNGALDELRIWTTDLDDGAIAALAQGAAPDTLAQSGALLAEYSFESSQGTPLSAAMSYSGQLDETAGSAGGPFHASAAGDESLAIVNSVPAALQSAGTSTLALDFNLNGGVPPGAVAYYAGVFTRQPAMVAMEVLNATRPLSEYPLDRELWDHLLAEFMPYRPIWGIATDDMHSMSHFNKEWAMFLTETLEEAAVREAVHQGRFYFSSNRYTPYGTASSDEPPRIDWIEHDPVAGTIEIHASIEAVRVPEADIKWISHGAVVETGSLINYRSDPDLGDDARYIRAEIYGAGGSTFTNPYGFAPIGSKEDSDADQVADWWEQAYFADPMGATAAEPAPGGSGMSILEHYIIGSDPFQAGGALALDSILAANNGGDTITLRWPSVAGRLYSIRAANDLRNGMQPLDGAESITATPPMNEFKVPIETAEDLGVYQIGVRVE